MLLTSCGHVKDESEIKTAVLAAKPAVSTDANEAEPQPVDTALPEESGAAFFGACPQKNGTAERIEWLVLDEQDNHVLLLTTYCIDALSWHNTHEPVTWDNCDLRIWLNNNFLQAAFSPEEQDNILLSDLENRDDLNYGTPVGENTQDKVSLLSGAELLKRKPMRIITSEEHYTDQRIMDANNAFNKNQPPLSPERAEAMRFLISRTFPGKELLDFEERRFPYMNRQKIVMQVLSYTSPVSDLVPA